MEYRKLSTLKKLDGNPRIIRDKQFQNLVASIKENPKFFEARPLILSDRTGSLVIIAGNQRYEAAKAAGLKEAPTYLMEGLTEAKEKEIRKRKSRSGTIPSKANGIWIYCQAGTTCPLSSGAWTCRRTG